MKLLRISAISAICALAQLQLLEKASGLDTNLQFAMSAVIARKEWSGFRSRILGPELVHLLGGDRRAFLIVTFAGLVIGGLLAWRLAGAFGLGIYHAGFALFANPWFTPWDIFEPVFFTAFIILIVESKPAPYFVALFSVAIFNLQTAMFIPLWMIISRKMILPGLFCMIAGIVTMHFLQHSELPRLGFHVIGAGWGTNYFEDRFVENLHSFDWLVGGIFAVIIAAAVSIIPHGYLPLALTFIALLVATLLFALIPETRVYLDFIPLFILAAKISDFQPA